MFPLKYSIVDSMSIYYPSRFTGCIDYGLVALLVICIVFSPLSMHMAHGVSLAVSPTSNLYGDNPIDYAYGYLRDNVYPLYMFLQDIGVRASVKEHYDKIGGYRVYTVYWEDKEYCVKVYLYRANETYIATGFRVVISRGRGEEYVERFINKYYYELVDTINDLVERSIGKAHNYSLDIECVESDYSYKKYLIKYDNIDIVFYSKNYPVPASIDVIAVISDEGVVIEYIDKTPIVIRCLERTSSENLRWKANSSIIAGKIYQYIVSRHSWLNLASIDIDSIKEVIERKYLVKEEHLVPVYIIKLTSEKGYLLLYVDGSNGEIIGEEYMLFSDTPYEPINIENNPIQPYYIAIIIAIITLTLITYILVSKQEIK